MLICSFSFLLAWDSLMKANLVWPNYQEYKWVGTFFFKNLSCAFLNFPILFLKQNLFKKRFKLMIWLFCDSAEMYTETEPVHKAWNQISSF